MKTVDKIVGSLKAHLSLDDSYKNIVAGMESSDPILKQNATEKHDTMDLSVKAAFDDVVIGAESSDVAIDDVQIAAAKAVAMYAVDPVSSLQSFAKGRQPIAAGSEATIVDSSRFVGDVVNNEEFKAGVEAFDGQVLDNSLYFSVAYNALAIKQDAVVELFYPVIVTDPSQVGATVKGKITNIMQATKRDISGRPTNFKRESLIKKLNDTALFTLDANRLYPVKRDESLENLLVVDGVNGLVKKQEVLDGVTIETAPLKASKKIDVLAIAQSDELLASGYMDETDALNGSVNVEELYFKVTGKDKDGNDVTEYMSKRIKGLPATFTYTPTGSNKELQLDYKTTSLTLVGGAITKVDGTPTAIAALADLPAGYTIKLEVNLKGDGQAQDGTVAIYPTVLDLYGITNASGVEVPADDQVYTDVKTVIDTMTLEGYDLEAFAANSNARFRGKLLTTNTYAYAYTVPVRTKVREIVPVIDSGENGDTAGIIAQIDFTKRAMGKLGLVELNNAAVILESVSEDTEDFGISTKLVNKYLYKGTIDFSSIVNSIKSSDREGDIESALRLTIRNAAIAMYGESNYYYAFESVYQGAKPTVIIGTDFNTARFLTSFEDEIFKYEVRASGDSLIAGKLFMSFGIMGANRNKEANMLNFGACFWSPEVVVSLQRNDGGKVAHETITMPRFKHQTFMPVLSVFEVSGIEAVSGKQAIDFKQI